MNTTLNFLNNPMLTEHQSTYQRDAFDELGYYLILDSTIFRLIRIGDYPL